MTQDEVQERMRQIAVYGAEVYPDKRDVRVEVLAGTNMLGGPQCQAMLVSMSATHRHVLLDTIMPDAEMALDELEARIKWEQAGRRT